jgi:ABC-type oligopeptide transport system substrate-binding subunit
LAARQVLTFPDVGVADSAPLDPATVTDPDTSLIVSMAYSGLVRDDNNLNVIPDQATWDVSPDNTVYTFHLKSGIMFSDGTPVTATTYVYSFTRALLPTIQSSMASILEGSIVGASDVMRGKAKTLAGVKAIDSLTLRITLTHSTPYFLQMLTNPLFFPVNKLLIEQYGQPEWLNHIIGNGIGTGPFMVKDWAHGVKMVLVPNPYYYGAKTKLTEVDVVFQYDATVAFKSYSAGQYDFTWNIAPSDQLSARGLPGFKRMTQLQTDAIFFNTQMPPFDNATVRQAFAYATDKATLAHTFFNDTVTAADTIVPPGMPGYVQHFSGIPFDKNQAKTLLQSVYPDVTTMPPVVFSYSNSQISLKEAQTLQQMWQDALGITVTLRSVEPTAYSTETDNHQIQMGFIQWSADFADPYDALALNLLSTAEGNVGNWSNASFDQILLLADRVTGSTRLSLYAQAEQIALQDVAWLPLDHETLAAIIPSWVHGVSLNANGLYFGDWSDVYLLQRA